MHAITDLPVGCRIQVQNLRDPLADSEPVWEPIYLESTLFVQKRLFARVNTVKHHWPPSCPSPEISPRLSLRPWLNQSINLHALPRLQQLRCANDPLRNFSMLAGLAFIINRLAYMCWYIQETFQQKLGVDLGVTWVCVHDLTWHQTTWKSTKSPLMTRLDLKFSWLKSATCNIAIIV